MFIKKDIFLECVDLKGKNSMFFGDYLIILLPPRASLNNLFSSLFLPCRPPEVGEASSKPQALMWEVTSSIQFVCESCSCLFVVELGGTVWHLQLWVGEKRLWSEENTGSGFRGRYLPHCLVSV